MVGNYTTTKRSQTGLNLVLLQQEPHQSRKCVDVPHQNTEGVATLSQGGVHKRAKHTQKRQALASEGSQMKAPIKVFHEEGVGQLGGTMWTHHTCLRNCPSALM